jgi:hypothetical protein
MKSAALFAIVCAALAVASPSEGAIGVGVADNTLLGNADGGASFLALMNDVGLRELRIPVRWDPARPSRIEHEREIRALLPVAALRGVNVALSVQGAHARALSSPQASTEFPAFMQRVARAFPAVEDVIVGNEPNQPKFWQPQYDELGRNVSGSGYETILAASYDALKAVNPEIDVVGLGLSSRGNDDPGAAGNVSTSPVRFLQELGAAYRASGRARPLMDELAYHPYPRRDTDSLAAGYLWPNAGVTNMGRIKQAFWDAFNGTGQPTFEDGLRLRLDEVGWQVRVPRASLPGYFGSETVKPTSEARQAAIYSSLVRYAACDPTVDALLFFGMRDEANLARWQAGLVRANGTPRKSYLAVKAVLAETGGNCVGKMRSWRHSTKVAGSSARFARAHRLPSRVRSWSFLASAGEDAVFDAAVYRWRGDRGARLLTETGQLDANVTRIVRFRSKRLRPGRYVYSIRFRAAANESRITRKTSPPFVVYRAR